MLKRDITARGFTLIELLVVVLIIGILAAIAVPQYQKAVEKSRISEAVVLARATGNAMEIYKMQHGQYPTSIDDLDIEIPSSKNFDFRYAQDAVSHFILTRTNSNYDITYFGDDGKYTEYSNKIVCRAKTENTAGVAICKATGKNMHRYKYNERQASFIE